MARRRRRRPARRRADTHRLRRTRAVPGDGVPALPSSSCTSSRARSSRTKASRSASSPACRASRGPSSTITGQSAHAGTTPMRMRRDPGYAAARIVTFVRDLTAELGEHQVATVGRLDLTPDLVNVVPATATFTVDLRNTDEATLQVAEQRIADELEHVARRRTAWRWQRPLAGALRTGGVRHRHGRPRRGGRDPARDAPRGGCRAVPATTPRCWRGSARRR